MTNVNRPLPSVELAKLIQPAMRKISEIQTVIQEVATMAKNLEEATGRALPKEAPGFLVAEYGEMMSEMKRRAQQAEAKCAAAQAAFLHLRAELGK
jgi:hypothetical protein